MAIRYYDHLGGRERLKPRYKWGMYAFVAGVILGLTCGHLI
jgi:hypothetical protein